MQEIPLQAVPSQTVQVTLNGQICQIELYQLASGLYCNLSANGSLIIGGVICQNINRIVRSEYLGFIGDLLFVDNIGKDDPSYGGLGSRFSFVYLTPTEIPS